MLVVKEHPLKTLVVMAVVKVHPLKTPVVTVVVKEKTVHLVFCTFSNLWVEQL